MISHAFNSASTCLHTAASSKPLHAFPKFGKASSAPETGSSPTGVAKKQDPELSTSHSGKGLQNSSVSKKADKIRSHGSHTEKANCWYHSSKDTINTQLVELLLVHLMRPPASHMLFPLPATLLYPGWWSGWHVSPSKHLPWCPKSELHSSSYHRLPWYETWSNRANDCAWLVYHCIPNMQPSGF